ncbi:heme-binding protein (plasmid) [Microvirga terrae]|uniref:Heme-binding protein n=1 Tax=Microvirga terrae TaxID=2740529 RepID=A0ABY5RY18_9HYPH|nr:heme-binding protein [Microvirga terrae]UVF22160.1 heme-binding protein [Microvirga terrae]
MNTLFARRSRSLLSRLQQRQFKLDDLAPRCCPLCIALVICRKDEDMYRSQRLTLAPAALVIAGSLATPALGQSEAHLPQKRVLTLEIARQIARAAESEAIRVNAPGVIAVVDDAGWLVLLVRMDNAPMLASIELASGKARSAAIYRKPTRTLEETINKGRIAAVTAPGFVQMQGGMPLKVGSDLVGAIGVSADTPDHDQQIAEAGVRALMP